MFRLKPDSVLIDCGQHSDDPGQGAHVDVSKGSCRRTGVKSRPLGGRFTHAVAVQPKPVGVVDEPVEDGVGDRGVADHFVPVIDRELAGHDGRAAIVPIVDDLQQIATLIMRQRGEPPVVEDQQLNARTGPS